MPYSCQLRCIRNFQFFGYFILLCGHLVARKLCHPQWKLHQGGSANGNWRTGLLRCVLLFSLVKCSLAVENCAMNEFSPKTNPNTAWSTWRGLWTVYQQRFRGNWWRCRDEFVPVQESYNRTRKGWRPGEWCTVRLLRSANVLHPKWMLSFSIDRLIVDIVGAIWHILLLCAELDETKWRVNQGKWSDVDSTVADSPRHPEKDCNQSFYSERNACGAQATVAHIFFDASLEELIGEMVMPRISFFIELSVRRIKKILVLECNVHASCTIRWFLWFGTERYRDVPGPTWERHSVFTTGTTTSQSASPCIHAWFVMRRRWWLWLFF